MIQYTIIVTYSYYIIISSSSSITHVTAMSEKHVLEVGGRGTPKPPLAAAAAGSSRAFFEGPWSVLSGCMGGWGMMVNVVVAAQSEMKNLQGK